MDTSKKESIKNDVVDLVIRVNSNNKYFPLSLFQIDPDQDPINGGCIFIVLEVHDEYAYGYIPIPASPFGRMPYRLKIGDGCFVGVAKMYVSD